MAARLEVWAPQQAARFRALDGAMRRLMEDLRSAAVDEAQRRAPKRTRRLELSIVGELKPYAQGYSLLLTARAPYGRIQEEGGTIQGRPYLAIPLREDVRRRGSPRADGKLFVVELKGQRLFLASRDGARLDLRWRLVRQVTIRPQPFMRPALEATQRRLSAGLARTFSWLVSSGSGTGTGGAHG